jgi:hypothetical protein
MTFTSSSSSSFGWPGLVLISLCICTLFQTAQLSPPQLVQLDASFQGSDTRFLSNPTSLFVSNLHIIQKALTFLALVVSGQHLVIASLALVITSTMFGISAAMTKKPGYMIMAIVTYVEYITTIYSLFGLGFVSLLEILLYTTALGFTGWEICQRELSLGRDARHVVYYDCHGKAFWTDGRVTDGAISL